MEEFIRDWLWRAANDIPDPQVCNGLSEEIYKDENSEIDLKEFASRVRGGLLSDYAPMKTGVLLTHKQVRDAILLGFAHIPESVADNWVIGFYPGSDVKLVLYYDFHAAFVALEKRHKAKTPQGKVTFSLKRHYSVQRGLAALEQAEALL